jgi:phage terminase large subunit GpA-like protein
MVRISPKRQPLPVWIEENVRLPAGVAAEPGPIKLYPYQRGIATAVGDPKIERITVLKSARIGYTALLTSALAHFVVREPSPILVLMPTEADCRDYMVSDVEPLFLDSPALRDHLPMPHPGRSDRNTLLHRLFPGGSLKIVAGKAPRNLCRHTARVLMIDEADAIEVSAEGDPITLAEKRTLSFADRKIIVGSTPLDEATSHVVRLYEQSDQRPGLRAGDVAQAAPRRGSTASAPHRSPPHRPWPPQGTPPMRWKRPALTMGQKGRKRVDSPLLARIVNGAAVIK